MQKRWLAFTIASMFLGALGGSLLAPEPAGAVAKEIIELQQQVSQLLQGQQDLRSALDSNSATLRTLVQQSLDGVGQLNTQMGGLQKTLQEVQANTGSRIDTMAQQSQGISDNLQDVQSRVGKLSQQLTDMQNLLQSIDAKVSVGAVAPGTTPAGTPPAGSTAPGPGASNLPYATPPNGGQAAGPPPISSETLYQNALRDYTSGKYDLARQEFSDYIKNFPSNDLASNAQFYLGEIYFAQNDFKNAIPAYDLVITNYPHSFKSAASLYQKASAELELGMHASASRDLRDVVRRFPGTDEARRAQGRLHEIGATTTPTHPAASH